ncbi:MAG: 3-deoxy-D-manno-octulosonic acid transferase [Nitrospiraceae bacterium]
MWYLAYNILLILASPIILLVLLAKKRCRPGLLQRLGLGEPDDRFSSDGQSRKLIWIHAVSLGEVVAAAPLVRELRGRYPEYRLVVSTVTETGREAVEQRLAGMAQHRYAPLDFPWVVSRAIRRLNPSLYLFVETELWPNLLRALKQRGVPTILINGRLSSRSFSRQQLGIVRAFYRDLLRSISFCLMQSPRDVERIIALGADPNRVRRIGNIKFDQPLPAVGKAGPQMSRQLLGLHDMDELFVAGSTHPGEEEQIVSSYRTLHKEFPSLVLLLAPRHIERTDQVEAMIRAAGCLVSRRSTMNGNGRVDSTTAEPRVILLDTRGELALVYQFAVVSFVGGTLVPVCGHNLLEPAMWGKPVLFGPNTDHCAEVAALLLQAGGGASVSNAGQLVRETERLLRDRSELHTMGESARQVVIENQGALERSVAVIESVLPRGDSGRESYVAGVCVNTMKAEKI